MSWVKSNADHNDTFRSALGDSWQLMINFGDFDIDLPNDPWNRVAAQHISTLLMSQVNQDDLAPMAWEITYNKEEEYPQISMGGGGMAFSAPTTSHAYAAMSAAFSSYSLSNTHTLYMGKLDYLHLKSLLEYLTDETLIKTAYIDTLQKTVNQFAIHYSDHDKGFLLELL